MSFIDRFRARKAVTPIVEVPIEVTDKDGRAVTITFRIARFAAEEFHAAGLDAHAFILKHDLTGATDANNLWAMEFNRSIFQRLRKHVKGWRIDGGEEVPFSKENADILFSEMTADEQAQFIAAYSETAARDEKNAQSPGPTTVENS